MSNGPGCALLKGGAARYRRNAFGRSRNKHAAPRARRCCKPMTVLDQLALPDTDLTRAMFTWNTNVFLFEANVGSRDTFKVVEQQSDLQTAEEHYATEEQQTDVLRTQLSTKTILSSDSS